MGLSLRNIGRKIGDVLGGVERQINPFDNGATYSNPNPPPPQRTAAPNTPPPGILGNNSPVQLGGMFRPPPPTQQPQSSSPAVVMPKRSALPAPATLHPAANTGPLINNAPNTGAPLTNNSPVRLGTVPVNNPNSLVNKPGLPYQTPGFVSNVLQPAFRALPNIGVSAADAILRTNQNFQPQPGIEQAVFGKQPITSYQQRGQGVNKALSKSKNPIVRTLAPALAVGSQVLNAAGDVAIVAPAAKAPVAGAKVLFKGAPEVVSATKPITTAEKAAATIKAEGAPTAPVATPAAIPKTSMPEVNKAIQDVSAQYATPSKFSGSLQDVVGQAQGQSSIGSRAANGLRKALSNNLSKAENQSVSDILDVHPGALERATPKAQEAAGALKVLQDQGFGIRQAINPKINRVQDYVSRIPANTVGAAVNAGSKVLGKIRSLSDITNLNSVFSQSRQVGKFVGKDGAVYGNPSNLGLVRHTDGTITDASGNAFKQVAVSKRELEANGAGKYEHNISRISGIYHADTASLKVRAEALQHLQSNPEAVGLHTVDTAPAGSVPVTKVPELSGMYGAPKDVKALEDNFGFKNATGPIGKAYDAVSNVATQFIVLNPAFHGMNQLYQTGIAAGNMPGAKTGWMKVAKNVMNVSEDDIRGYLASGGHIPDYGMGRENLLSNMTHGATKLNNKAMNAIETKLRVGLYKASMENKMAPKDAVANIDKFLGDSHGISAATRRFTLFFHYFKTMGSALGSQVAHPIENIGANVNTAALAAITAAVSYGYQEFTGNKNAYVRVPGELGLAKEAIGSVEGLAKGDAAKATQVATNRVNPVLKEGAQQVFNKDLFTGKKVTETGRLAHAEKSLIAPAQTASRVSAGSKNLVETGSNQLGLYTPHAKGYQASPNVPALNTPGAISGNGVAEQTAYFSGKAQALKSLSGDTASTDAFNKFVDRSHDPNTGQSIQNSPAESQQNSSALATNDKLRTAVQKFESSQPSHDPKWDLSPDKLKVLMQYKAQFTGDAAKNFILSQNPWIKDVETQQQDYYANLKLPGGAKGSVASSQTPAYPQFDAFTQGLLDRYNSGTPAEKSTLLQNYGQKISQAWGQKADWTNAMRRAEGAPELKGYPVADAATQQIMKTFNALPKGNGPKGGSPNRAAWIKANPGLYAKMQDYMSQAAMSSLVKNASLDQFQGATADQALLKDIKNLGTYDIATTKNADGTTSYSLNPSAATAAYGNSSTGGSKFSSSFNNADRRAYKDAKALRHTNRIVRVGTKIKRPSVKVSKGSRSVKFKGPAKVATTSKVALKPSKV